MQDENTNLILLFGFYAIVIQQNERFSEYKNCHFKSSSFWNKRSEKNLNLKAKRVASTSGD